MRRKFDITIPVLVVIAIAVVLLLFSVRVIPQEKACVWVRLGKIVGAANPGLQIVPPFITGTDCYSQQVTLYQTGEEENKAADYWDYPVEVKTKDGQTAFVSFNLTYHVEPANAVSIRTSVANNADNLKERVIAAYARSIPRNVAANYTATELYTTRRVDYENEVEATMRTSLLQEYVSLNDFMLRDVNFSPEYELAIEQQQINQELIETEAFKVEQERQKALQAVERAKGEAAAAIETAKGQAESARIMADAEAYSINMKGAAINANPSILELLFIEALKTANWMMVPWSDMQGWLPITP